MGTRTLRPARTDSALTLFGGAGVLTCKSGQPMAPLTRRAYAADLRSVWELLAEGRAIDTEAEARAWAARAAWATARQTEADLAAPASSDTIIGEFFALNPDRVRRLIAQLQQEEYAVSTICRRIAGLRTIWRNLVNMRLVDGDPFVGINRSLPRRRRQVKPASPAVWHFFDSRAPEVVLKEFGPVLHALSPQGRNLALRDLAMATLFVNEGVKPSEIITVREGDFSPPSAGKPATLRIGRGKEGFVIPLSTASARYLEALVSGLYPQALQNSSGSGAGLPTAKRIDRALFPNKDGQRQVSNRSMRRKIATLLTRLKLKPATPAQLRHAAIIAAIIDGVDDPTIVAMFFKSRSHPLGDYHLLAPDWQTKLEALKADASAAPAPMEVVEAKPASSVHRPAPPASPVSPARAAGNGHPVYGRARPIF